MTDNAAVLRDLADSLPPGTVILAPDQMAGYLTDQSPPSALGTPAAVVRATSVADVQAAIRAAASVGAPVVTRGAGTGLSGGANATQGCVVVSTERLTRIHVDPHTRTAIAGAGALNSAIKAAASKHGLWYPPDPSSHAISTIGGNVATNAGGLCCLKYGVTADYVLGLTVVTADAEAVTLGGPRLKDVAGLPLAKLFAGSEGTLGVITDVTLRLLPQPPPPHTLVATFARLEDSALAVHEVVTQMRPSMLELMDRTTINAVEDMTRMGLDRRASALLVMQTDALHDQASSEVARMTSICVEHGASEVFATLDVDEGEAFVSARRAALPALERRGTVLLDDVAVPVPRLHELLRGIQTVARDREVRIGVIAHAGDGNAHPVIVFDAQDPQQVQRAEAAFGDIMHLALELGGTITGEHGVGRLKLPWVREQLGDNALKMNRAVRHALDPLGLFNPGVGY